MSISVETYRTRIGNFNAIKMRKYNYISSPVKQISAKQNVKRSLIIIIILLSFQIYCSNNGFRFQHLKTTNSVKVRNEKTVANFGVNIGLYSWSQSGLSVNKIQKIINGNRRSVGYRFAMWNCGRGLMQDGFSAKFHEVKQFLQTKRPHCFGIVESDLFSHESQSNRVKYSTAELKESLKVDGYNIEFPKSWETYGQARVICYVSQEVKYKRKLLNNNFDHLLGTHILTTLYITAYKMLLDCLFPIPMAILLLTC